MSANPTATKGLASALTMIRPSSRGGLFEPVSKEGEVRVLIGRSLGARMTRTELSIEFQIRALVFIVTMGGFSFQGGRYGPIVKRNPASVHYPKGTRPFLVRML